MIEIGPNTRNIVERLKEAWDDNETYTELGQAIARLKVPFVVGDGKKWYYERIISFMAALRQAIAAIDVSVSPDLPPFMLEPSNIAKLFGIPLEDLNWQGSDPAQKEDEAANRLASMEARLDGRLEEIVGLLRQKEASPSAASSRPGATLTKQELARQFQVSTRTVDRWRSMGLDLGEITVRGTVRFDPEKIANIIATKKFKRRRQTPTR